VLDSQPTSPVFIQLHTSDATEGIANPLSITFTPDDWSIPATIQIDGQDDDLVDGDQPYSIIIDAAVSEDPRYNGLNAQDVSVTNLEDDEFDGSYLGTYSGTATGSEGSFPVSGSVAFTVSNGVITVTEPGGGSGTLTSDGSGSFAAAIGGGFGCNFGGSFFTSPEGVFAGGSWTCTFEDGTAAGGWSATRVGA
jgi:hypothetical protein